MPSPQTALANHTHLQVSIISYNSAVVQNGGVRKHQNSYKKLATISGIMYIRLDAIRDGIHPFPIARSWKEVSGPVDAVFSYGDKIYIIQVKQNYCIPVFS